MAAVVFAGARAATLVLQLIGYRVAGTMALASIGPTLLTAAVRLLGGPLAYLPPSLLNTAIRKATSAPMVMLLGQSSATTGFVVRAALVVVSTLAEGMKYMVINLAASSATKAIRALIKRAIYGAEPEPMVKAIPNMATIEIIENYDARRQPTLSPAQREARRQEEKQMKHISSVSSSSDSSSDSLPPPTSLGARVTDGVQLQVVECSNDELEKLMASIQLPPTHDPKVPKNANGTDKAPSRQAVPAMVDADRLVSVLDKSTRKLEESIGEFGYPKLEELKLDDFVEAPTRNPALQQVEMVLADSIMAEELSPDEHRELMTKGLPAAVDVELLRSRLQPSFKASLAPNGASFSPESMIQSWFELPPSAPPLSISDFELINNKETPSNVDDPVLTELLEDDNPFIPDGAGALSSPSKFYGTRSQPVDARSPSSIFAESKK